VSLSVLDDLADARDEHAVEVRASVARCQWH